MGKRARKGKEPRGNRRELAGTCIKGSYRDKGINTSTKRGEFDGRSSSKSYLFEPPPRHSLPPSFSLAHMQLLPPPSPPFSRYRSPGSRSLPIPSCPPLSTAAVGSPALFDSRCSTAVWERDSATPDEIRARYCLTRAELSLSLYPSLRRWKLDRAMPHHAHVSGDQFLTLCRFLLPVKRTLFSQPYFFSSQS